ncbi:UPF0182 family protein [Spirulina major]|uniref:UPF0182 family protein n=1 Tax=Spirulina major TaxID=270636 RepID=UPI00093335CA|nr:UPF0182 family protein [Spirulina major]
MVGKRGIILGFIVVGLLLADRGIALIAQILWFEEVGYQAAFWTRMQTQVLLWVGVSGLSALFYFKNLAWCDRHQYPHPAPVDNRPLGPLPLPPKAQSLSLRWLLPITVSLAVFLGWLTVQYAYVAFQYGWLGSSVPTLTPDLPPTLSWRSLIALFAPDHTRLWLIVAAIALGIIVRVQWMVRGLGLVVVVLLGYLATNHWTRLLTWQSATPFYERDPLFNLDISFYLFRLPVIELMSLWFAGLALVTLIACLLVYLLSGDSLSQGRFPGFSPPQLRHLYRLGGVMMGAIALQHVVTCFQRVYSTRGAVYGAGYTDVNLQLPWEIGLGCIALGIGIGLIWQSTSRRRPRDCRLLTVGRNIIILYLIPSLLGLTLSSAMQRFNVQPNELERETPYLTRSIAATRNAFGLDAIEAQTFDPQDTLSLAQIEANPPTIDNIRLWDTRPLLQANRQLQEIRLYYSFNDADIDRYTIQRYLDDGTIETQTQQMIIAPRELDYDKVEGVTKTWVNEHLVYTHGYGFTLSPVNRVGEGGLPAYDVQDIGTEADAGQLQIADDLVPGSIPLGRPRIYFGELTHTHILTSTKVQEFDFPSGADNVLNTYDGTGGIALDSLWRRWVFAAYLRDWPMLFTENFTPETRLLFRRTITRRLQEIAPFLRYDSDPYLVVADVEDQPETSGEGNYLYWMIDAYTTSDRYPYSDPGENPYNYIRNSVKVVVDAYNGDVTFYIADPTDPIIQTWHKIFPQLFRSLEQMPPALRSHLRYPADLFNTQSERLLTYHMREPRVFYNREDQWAIPQEIYADTTQPVESYHLIMRLPTANNAEFVLLHPYSPVARPNLIAWLAARSDGDNYGKLLLYQFPKQKLVFGVSQIEALINQDPEISQQISLWNTQGSQAVQGNLLVIPIEDALLYVEPLYLEAEQNSVPTLARVIVAYDNTIVMAKTLDQALQELFTPSPTPDTPEVIRRSVDTPAELLTPIPSTPDPSPTVAP